MGGFGFIFTTFNPKIALNPPPTLKFGKNSLNFGKKLNPFYNLLKPYMCRIKKKKNMKKKTKLRVLKNITNALEFAAIIGSGIILSLAADKVADKVLTKSK